MEQALVGAILCKHVRVEQGILTNGSLQLMWGFTIAGGAYSLVEVHIIFKSERMIGKH